MMIARMWSAMASPHNADAYSDHFQKKVLPEVQAIDGYEGCTFLRHDRTAYVEFIVLTTWQSMEAIKLFAGEDPTVAVVPAAAAKLLIDFDERVRHFDVIAV